MSKKFMAALMLVFFGLNLFQHYQHRKLEAKVEKYEFVLMIADGILAKLDMQLNACEAELVRLKKVPAKKAP